MRILFDECVPRALRRSLPGHEVLTAAELGWAGKKNGELMRLIGLDGFDVFITVDQNIRFQQQLHSAAFGIIVLSAASNRLADLLPLMTQVNTALPSLKRSAVLEIRA